MKKKQKIPDSTLENIVAKIKSHTVYNMALLFDRCHEYDPHEFDVVNTNENDSSTELSQNSGLTEQKETENRMIKFHNIKKGISDLNKNMKQIAEDLIKNELSVIKSFGVSHEDYFNSLLIALQTNKKIQQDLKFLTEFKQNFENDNLMYINFGQTISEKFLKIVSNIYYLNLREVSRSLKFNYYDKGVQFEADAVNKIVFGLYEKNLKRIR